jgi:hypothetical protein
MQVCCGYCQRPYARRKSAHIFAETRERVRATSTLSLCDVPWGIGWNAGRLLRALHTAGFETVGQINEADDDELLAVKGVGLSVLADIRYETSLMRCVENALWFYYGLTLEN